MEPTYLKPKALSNRWGISTGTLGQWRWNGRGPHYLKMGRHIVYRLQDIEEFEKSRRRRNTSENSPPDNPSKFSDPSNNSEENYLENILLLNKKKKG